MLKKLGVLAIVIGSCTSVLAVGCSSSSDANGGSSEEDSGSGSKKDGGGSDGGLTGEDSGLSGKDGGLSGKDGGISTKDSGIVDEDSGTTTHFDAGTGADASTDGGTVVLSDGGSAPACYDLGGAVYYPDATAATAHQNKCSATLVAGFYTACLDTGATTTTCNNFRTANAACDTCIEGASSGTYAFPAVAEFDDGTVEVSYLACYAALSTGNAACKVNVPNEAVCVDSACLTCTTDADACQDTGYADTAGCQTVAPVDTTCADAVNAASGVAANQTACGASAADFHGIYTAVTTTLCGP